MAHPISRRNLIKGAGTLAAGAAGATALASCSKSGGSSGGVQIVYEFLATRDLPDAGLVQDAMNQRLKDLGKTFTVQLKPLDSATFKTRMPLELASGSAGDVCYTANWINVYSTNASQGLYAELDDLLPAQAPGLWKSFTPETWNATRVGGKIYGTINEQIWPYTWGVIGQQSVADKYGLKLDAINAYADLTPYFKEIHAAEPKLTVWLTDNGGHGSLNNATWDSIGYGLALDPDDDNLKLFQTVGTDFYREGCELLRTWHLAGYTKPNPPSATDATAAWNNGSIAFQGNQANGNATAPFPMVQKSLQPLLVTTGTVTATLSAVNQATKHPEEAVQFLELLNTDKQFYNLICFGIKDKHYVIKDEALNLVGFPDGVTAQNSPYNPNTDWQFGNQFNAYYRDEAQAKAKRWEVDKKKNDDAKRSKALGFVPDVTELKSEIAALTAVSTQTAVSLALGLVDPGPGIKNALELASKAGIDKVQATLQAQLDKWAETNK